MLYTRNLEEIIFNRFEFFAADEMVVISGYLGPDPISRLQELPHNSTVVYGMYATDRIKPVLHRKLINLQQNLDNVNIYYSNIPVHSKCYIWKNRHDVIYALVGSANFSRSGLCTPYKEVLAETTRDTFAPLDEYVTHILNNCILCTEANPEEIPVIEINPDRTPYCRMTLLDPQTNEVQNFNGLNWGQNPQNHTNPNDANIPIRAEYIRNYPDLFPPKRPAPLMPVVGGRAQRNNDSIEIIWDDGIVMQGLLEGNCTVDGILFPKQICSFPEKHILGTYLRHRLRAADGARVTRRHLEAYGRTHVDVSLLSEGIYSIDFSV